jgi:hypothetical protein
MRKGLLTSAIVALGLLISFRPEAPATRAQVPLSRTPHAHAHKTLRIRPACFVAGHRTWAHIVLNRVGAHDKVEFGWAKPGIISLGPGLGPGVYRAKASGVVRFAAFAPSRYGRGQIGRWQLTAKWPKAAHPFVKTFFRRVRSRSDCTP